MSEVAKEAETKPESSEEEYVPLFEGERVTEAELKGEEPTEKDKPADSGLSGETPDQKKAEEKDSPQKDEKKDAPPDGEKKEAKEKEAEKKEGEKKPAEEKKEADTQQKPPPGFVPHAALKEARDKIKSLQSAISTLQASKQKETAPKKEEAVDDRWNDFQVKTTDEYKTLLQEDPDAASLYLYEHNQYVQHKSEQAQKEQEQKKAEEAERSLVMDGAKELEKALPGFYEPGNEDVKALADYVVESGVKGNLLFDVTNPGTKIITSEGSQYVLGTGAAQLVKFMKAAFDNKPQDIDQIKKDLEKELRPQIEKEVQETVMKKIKSQDGFKSLDSATKSSDLLASKKTGLLSESDWAKLPEDERTALLGG